MSSKRIKYQPGDSFLHRLHPLTKTAWLILGTFLVFQVTNPYPVLAAAILLVVAFPMIGIRFKDIRGTRMFLSTALVLAIVQLLFVREGAILVRFAFITLTTGGIQAGIYIAGRFLTVILLSYIFVLTTEPNDLAYALMRSGLPYRYGFTLVTALRLVPVFEREGQIVYKAQLARGVRYDIKHPRRIFILARQFILPLLISTLGKVDTLAVSMEGRCFGKYPKRTFLRQIHYSWMDGAAAGLLIIGITVVAISKFTNGGV
jgi:energy-coupling factor transport system permease protein